MHTTRLYMLLCLFILLTPLSQGNEDAFFKTVDLTYLTAAVQDGAVCLDGSPPAYQIDRGIGEDTNKWLVFLAGGGWCISTEDCLNRTRMDVGSSKLMRPTNFSGILSDNRRINPYFYNWNRIIVRYCDGASFTSNKYDPVHKLHYKGAKILSAVLKDLLHKGMSNATNALLYGCSAGGTAVILNCDKFRSFLPTHTTVKCASDGGYFVHVKDVFGEYNFAKTYIDGVVTTHGSVENLPKACTSTMKPKSMCFYPQYVLPHIKTPLLIINSAFDYIQIQYVLAPNIKYLTKSWARCRTDTRICSKDQVEILKGFRIGFLSALPRACNGTFRGMFITSCMMHCRFDHEPNKSYYHKFRHEQKQFIEVLGSWTIKGSPYQAIDHTDVPQRCTSSLL